MKGPADPSPPPHTSAATKVTLFAELDASSAEHPTTIGDLLGVDDAEVYLMGPLELERQLQQAAEEWAAGHISIGWDFTDQRKSRHP